MDPIGLIKHSICNHVNKQRLKILANGVEFNGKHYDASSSSISSLSALIAAMKLESTTMPKFINWRANDNTISNFDINDLINLLESMVKFTQEIYEESWQEKEKILLSTIDDLPQLAENSKFNDVSKTTVEK